LKSFFISGTDTDVGKTWITAGLAHSIKKIGIDVGVMKPFAAGKPQKIGFKSKDVEILSKAAQINDPEHLLNPQFFEIFASPYTAMNTLGANIDINLVLKSYLELSVKHEMMLVEGMGGMLTPILKNYFIAHLIKDLGLDTILITSSRIGTINHTLMTCKICQEHNITIAGIIINDFSTNGYEKYELKRDLEDLTGISVLGIIPHVEKYDIQILSDLVSKNINIKNLI